MKCPQCGLYYAPAGLTGHLRFYHKMGIGMKKQDPVDDALDAIWELERLELLQALSQSVTSGDLTAQKQVLDQALKLFLLDYLSKRGIFQKK